MAPWTSRRRSWIMSIKARLSFRALICVSSCNIIIGVSKTLGIAEEAPVQLLDLPHLVLNLIINKLEESEKKELRLVASALDQSVCQGMNSLAWNTCHCLSCSVSGPSLVTLPRKLLEKSTSIRLLNLGGNRSKALEADFLSGYKLPPSLTSLSVRNTLISSLDSLTQCWQIEKIVADSSQISSLSFIAGLTRMTTLSFQCTIVDSLAPIKGLSNLTELNISNTNVSDLGPLKMMNKLKRIDVSCYQTRGDEPDNDNDLELYDNPLTRHRSKVFDLSALSSCTNLVSIKAMNSSIDQLDYLSSVLVNLTELDFGGTFVSDLSPLRVCSSLESLRCGGWWASSLIGQLTLEGPQDLSPLSHLTRLSSIDCSYSKVEDLSPLSSCIGLKEINIQNNPISILPSKLPPDLETFNCCETDVTSLTPLSRCINLKTLDASRSPVLDISPVSACNLLTSLDVSNTLVSDLSPLTPCTRLRKLYIGGTTISDLAPAFAWPLLEVIQAASTDISDLAPLGKAVCRVSLRSICLCNCEHVTDLTPLSSCKLLQRLCVDGTRVDDLMSLAGCRSLKSLKCGQNRAGLFPLLKLYPELEVDPEPEADDN